MERLDKATSFITRGGRANLENTVQNHRDLLEEALSSTKVVRTGFLDAKIDKLESRMAEVEAGIAKKFKKMGETIEVLKGEVSEDACRGEANAVDQLTRLLKKRAEQLAGFERELAGRRQQEENVVRILDQQITSAKTELQRETLDRGRAISDLKKSFENEMNGLADATKAEMTNGAASISSMSNRFGSELDIAFQALQVELGNRIDLAKAVMDMKTDIQNRARNEMETMSAARKQSHNDIQAMLDMALKKINQGV